MKNYIKNAIKTENQDFEGIAKRIATKQNIRLLHAGIGLSTEANEFLDALKKHVFYGKELDIINLKEEVGDILWYLALICDELGLEFEQAMESNIAKLKARYPNKFSKEDAINRDLDKERLILEEENIESVEQSEKNFLTLQEVRAQGLDYYVYTKNESVYDYKIKRKGYTLVENGKILCENVAWCHWYSKGVYQYKIKGKGYTVIENDVILCENVYWCHWLSRGVYKYKQTQDSDWVKVGC